MLEIKKRMHLYKAFPVKDMSETQATEYKGLKARGGQFRTVTVRVLVNRSPVGTRLTPPPTCTCRTQQRRNGMSTASMKLMQ
jgi:hypothetical protein